MRKGMGPPSKRSKTSASSKSPSSSSSSSKASKLAPSGFLVTCDVPTKQFIKHLDSSKPVDKKFIIQDLDATHLLIDGRARDEIMRKVDDWMDEVCRTFSNLHTIFYL
mmetsp:Transcript_27634/g.42526  ORF Transcript_27634/g.42526 Transcript_27634/m.42526 type:complete len:108 (+) Transcript_27634:63-386(+)